MIVFYRACVNAFYHACVCERVLFAWSCERVRLGVRVGTCAVVHACVVEMRRLQALGGLV